MANYHYIISSLPELVFEADKFDFLKIKAEVLEALSETDCRAVHTMFYPVDNRNLLNLLYVEGSNWNEYGCFAHNDFAPTDEDAPKKPLPAYIDNFLNQYKLAEQEDKRIELPDAEKLLFDLFYKWAEKSNIKFISSWFRFDREVRNIQAAYVGRSLEMPFEPYLVGNDDITAALKKSNARDFGLMRERDYAPALFAALDSKGLTEKERKLDLFRWNQIDEINSHEYFSIDFILGFIQKAYIINRWLIADPETGKAMFTKLVKELQNSYDVTNIKNAE